MAALFARQGPILDVSIDPARKTLADALLLFARQSGEEIIFSYDLARKFPARPVRGCYTSAGVLALLLRDTPLTAYRNSQGTIIVRAGKAGARRLKARRTDQAVPPPTRVPVPQEAVLPGDGETDPAVEELVITGSRLERREFVTPTPLALVPSDMIVTSGVTHMENILNRFPQITPGLTGHSNNPGDGTATVDLRGLGTSRTLVLVDGRRYTPSNQTGVIDLNAIPAILIRQVEIATGGTSAVYGADAISGVVNFILRDDFQGGLLDGQYSLSSAGDAQKWNMDAVFGSDFGSGRGHAFLHAGYLQRNSLLQADRSFSRHALADGFIVPDSADPALGHGVPLAREAGGVPGLIRLGSAAIPETRIIGVEASGPYPGLQRFGAHGNPLPFNALEDSFNYAPYNFLQLPQKRWMISMGGKYDVTDSFRLQSRSIYSHNRVDTELAPTPAFMADVLVPVENPFLASESRRALGGIDWYGTGAMIQARDAAGNLLFDRAGAPVQARQAMELTRDDQGNVVTARALWTPDGRPVAATGIPDPTLTGNLLFEADGQALIPFLARRMRESGSRMSLNDRHSFNGVLSFEADLSDLWRWSGYYNYGHFSHEQRNVNDISERKLRQALNIVELDGKYVCADPAARAAGCVPANIYGAGNVSAAAAAYIGINTFSKTVYERQVASTQISGLVDTPLTGRETEGMKILLGADWRRESSRFTADEAVRSGDILGFNVMQGAVGNYDVFSLFGEIVAPLVEAGEQGRKLEFSGAFRYSDFQGRGGNWSYGAGLFWSPVTGLGLRGQYQRSVRAPNIEELYAGMTESFEEATDPCAAGYADAGTAVTALCESTGVPRGRTGDFIQTSSQIRVGIGGTPDLKEEFSDTFTAGIVLRPAPFGSFRMALDFYHIALYDRIDFFAGGAKNLLNLCYSGDDPDSAYCRAISRLPDGNLDYIDLSVENQGTARTHGLDLQLFYSGTFDRGLLGRGEGLDLYLQGNYTLGFRLDPVAGLRGPDCAGAFGGVCGDPHPRLRLTQMTRWSSGPLRLTLRWRYLGAVQEAALLDGATPAELAVPKIPAQQYVDVYAEYDLFRQLSLRAGVDNVFNNSPEPVGSSQQQANSFPNVYDVLGPYFYMGLQTTF